jgi:hypothetical protein
LRSVSDHIPVPLKGNISALYPDSKFLWYKKALIICAKNARFAGSRTLVPTVHEGGVDCYTERAFSIGSWIELFVSVPTDSFQTSQQPIRLKHLNLETIYARDHEFVF